MLVGSGGMHPQESFGILYRPRRNFLHSRKHVEAYVIATDFTHRIVEKESRVSGDGFTLISWYKLPVQEMQSQLGQPYVSLYQMSAVVVEKT